MKIVKGISTYAEGSTRMVEDASPKTVKEIKRLIKQHAVRGPGAYCFFKSEGLPEVDLLETAEDVELCHSEDGEKWYF